MIVFALSIVILTFIIKLFYDTVFKFWKTRNIPYRQPVPFFGNYAKFFLLQRNQWQIDADIYKEFPNDDLVGTYMGIKPHIMAKNPELIKHIMTKDFQYFYHRGFEVNDKLEPLSQNLFASSGDKWKVMRQHLTPLFTSGKLKNMFYLIIDCCDEFDGYLEKMVQKSNVQNVRDLTSRLTLDVIGSCAFGLQMKSMTEQSNHFHSMSRKIFQIPFVRFLKLVSRQMFPKLFFALGLSTSNPEVDQFFLKLVEEIISQRRAQKDRVLRHDFIDLMLEMYEKGSIEGDGMESLHNNAPKRVKIDIDFTMVTAQCFVFFAAGFETSSTTMSYALHELAHNKDIQEKVQNEIDKVLGNNRKLSYETVQEMHYLEMVVNETMRKYPVLSVITRKAVKKYQIPNSDKCIDKDVVVRIPVYGLHHDEKYYPEPEKFNPERFSEENIKSIPHYAYLPFGEGPRICIGMRFGKLQAMAGLVTILKKYSVEPTETTQNPLQFEKRQMITTAVGGIPLKLVPRKKGI